MSAAPRVAFLTHGGPDIGLGHVARCLSLARALAADGARGVFLLGMEARVTSAVEAAGFDAVETDWESAAAAAGDLVAALRPEALVVDSYAVSGALLDLLRPLVGQLVAIDDLADRPLPVHTVVNGAAGADHLEYRGGLPETVYLLGPRYALLDAAYAAAPERKTRPSVERVLVTLGGSSHPAALRAVVQAALSLGTAAVDVPVGPFAGEAVADAIGDARVVVHRGISALRPLMLAADVAISGAGMTLYELAATATPVVSVTMAPNQRPNAAAFERAGAALTAGSADHPDLGTIVARHLGRLAADAALREQLGAAGRRVVDGQGASRVARELASMPSPRR
jgi:UDP-2,4-diacetamido-2,4,6-trideoxy-beta-L-altropyranose hydrolase